MQGIRKTIIPILSIVLVCGAVIGCISFFRSKSALAHMLRISPIERIELAQLKYDSLKINPNQEIEVILSFQKSMPSDEVKVFLNKYQSVTVESVFQSVKCKGNTFSGAYIDCAGKDFDQIINAYRAEYLASLSNSLEDAQKNIRDMRARLKNKADSDDPLAQEKESEDEKAVQALENYISDLQQAIDQFNNDGIVIYGLKLRGLKSEFSSMTLHKDVRAIEILNDMLRDLTPIQP